MANSTVASGNVATHFRSDVFREYVRGGRFGPYTGQTENAVFQVKRDRKKVSIPLIGKLKGAGVKGSQSLAGSEEPLANYADTLTPTYYRNGVLVDNEENEKSEFELFREARPTLMNWAMELKRDQMIQALGAISAGGTYYNYGGSEGANGATAASAANMDTWVTNNTDRILYGNATANLTAGDHTTSLGTIDTTNDVANAANLSLAKRLAQLASPIIRPIRVNGDQEWYVLFCGSYTFGSLQEDSTISQANRDARPRQVMNNPLFTGDELVWNGIIIKEIPEIEKFIDGDSSGSPWDGVWGANATGDNLVTAGASTSRVGVAFLCGAQAVGFGLGQEPAFRRRKEDDYEHQNGVGISCKHDVKKLFYNNKQHGVVTWFHSQAAD